MTCCIFRYSFLVSIPFCNFQRRHRPFPIRPLHPSSSSRVGPCDVRASHACRFSGTRCSCRHRGIRLSRPLKNSRLPSRPFLQLLMGDWFSCHVCCYQRCIRQHCHLFSKNEQRLQARLYFFTPNSLVRSIRDFKCVFRQILTTLTANY